MEIYTSYFGNLKKIVEKGIVPVGIAVSPPKWYRGIIYKRLAPHYAMLQMSREKYDIEFQKILLFQNPREVHQDFLKFSQGKPIALLCFEFDRNDCHRLKVAEWIELKMGIKVPELVVPKAPKFTQTMLF